MVSNKVLALNQTSPGKKMMFADNFSLVQVGCRFVCGSLYLICFIVLLVPQLEAQQMDPTDFITVKQGPAEFAADKSFFELFDRNIIRQMNGDAYEVVVQKVLKTDANYVARMTPYAFVAAEMQGAQLHIIATYLSKSSGLTTYQTNFAVNKADFPNPGGTIPSMNHIVETLRNASENGEPFRFIYHKRLSTSSYFLPSLFFRSERIFSDAGGVTDPEESTIRISAKQYSLPNKGPSSSELLYEVARTPRTFAAVWDATRESFISKPEEKNVYFVQYPFKLPNDLLVATRNVDPQIRKAIQEKLEPGVPILTEAGDADVDRWVLWNNNEAKDARTALSDLRHAAITQPAPVIVRITNKTGQGDLGEAVKQAIRLSSTELVAFDDAWNRHTVEWTLETVHEGAVLLTVTYHDFELNGKVPTQEFRISYLDNEDLTQRIGYLIHSQMNRIRSVWPYQDDTPTIIRDVAFEVNKDLTLPYQLIKWSNPERNDFEVKQINEVKVKRLDFNKFELSREPFPLRPTSASNETKKLNFEPMGRAEYRVLLLRPTEVRMLFKALTVILLVLFAVGFVGVIWELRHEDIRNGSR